MKTDKYMMLSFKRKEDINYYLFNLVIESLSEKDLYSQAFKHKL